jgi:hypothetical protein
LSILLGSVSIAEAVKISLNPYYLDF